MNPEQWASIRGVLEGALDVPPEEFDAFVEAHSGSDPMLREALFALARQREGKDRFLETPAHEAVCLPAHQETGEDLLRAGRVGTYRVRRLIARGGMGMVYEAFCERLQRRVAVKVIRPGAATNQVLQRFRVESEIVARLTHPAIAQVFDAGVFQRENAPPSPYFVMEYVNGALPITEYATGKRLSIRQRVVLFMKVLAAVAHAHEHGVIHRDLKPANILVDSSGHPKVIDFGVARVTRARNGSLAATQVGQILGTPCYMSPEQILGDPDAVDVRSDVYALGVCLYELLTGENPHADHGDIAGRLARIASGEDVTPPSEVYPEVRGDLEWIVLKAMAGEASRRYPGVAAFREDLGRYLDNHPVSAGPPTTTYRLRKYLRRHPARAAAFAASMLSLIVVLALVGVGLLREQELRHRAEAVADYLTDVLLQADSDRAGHRLSVSELLLGAADGIEERLPDAPELRVRIRRIAGERALDDGRHERAAKLLEAALDDADRHLDPSDRERTAALRLLASIRNIQGRGRIAETLVREALQHDESRDGPTSQDAMSSRRVLAESLLCQGEVSESVALAREVADFPAHTLGADHPQSLNALAFLADCLARAGEWDEARDTFASALPRLADALGEDAPRTRKATLGLAVCEARTGRLDSAIARLEPLAARPSTDRDAILAKGLLASFLRTGEQRERALTLAREVAQALESKQTLDRNELEILAAVCVVLRQGGDHEASLAAHDLLVGAAEKAAVDPALGLKYRELRGWALLCAGREEGEAELLRIESELEPGSPDWTRLVEWLAGYYARHGRDEDARAMLAKLENKGGET